MFQHMAADDQIEGAGAKWHSYDIAAHAHRVPRHIKRHVGNLGIGREAGCNSALRGEMQYADHLLARGEILLEEDGESAMARVAATSGTDIIAQGFVIA